MNESNTLQCTAFAGSRRIGSGPLADVAVVAKAVIAGGAAEPVLIFDDVTSQVVDVDFRGSDADVIARLAPMAAAADGARDGSGAEVPPDSDAETPRGRGRPRLGVVAREVTLLPRHWDWLATQPGGASAAVRRLVDEARQTSAQKDRTRQAKESAYRFMSAMAGNEPGFEEATRALFANDAERFTEMTEAWPRDVRDHARALAARASA
jgi:uncharacterized protein